MLLIMRRINERMCRYDKMNYVVAIMKTYFHSDYNDFEVLLAINRLFPILYILCLVLLFL